MPPPSRRELGWIARLLLVSIVLRFVVVTVSFHQMGVDRDGYLEIANHLAAGDGFARTSHVGAIPQPTAYRPPFYPLLLALVFSCGIKHAGIALLHVLFGTLTVLFTWLIGRRLGLGRLAYLAAGLVACDPLLLQYTALPMTETLCTFLGTLLLWLVLETSDRVRDGRSSRLSLLWTGATFGICFLCRPTIGLFGLFALLWWIGIGIRRRSLPPRCVWPAVLAAAIVIVPWMVRNQIAIGRATPATTHGGYTLLLGNNPYFYDEVVARPWGTVWDDAPPNRTQAAWLKGVEQQLHKDLGLLGDDESSRDRWMYDRALQNIQAEPRLFLRACLLRFTRFWNVIPLAPSRRQIPGIVVVGVGLFYFVELIGLLIGSIVVLRNGQTPWFWLILVIAAFSLVHLFFWSNMRMRAPVLPAIALLSTMGLRCLVIWGRPHWRSRNVG